MVGLSLFFLTVSYMETTTFFFHEANPQSRSFPLLRSQMLIAIHGIALILPCNIRICIYSSTLSTRITSQRSHCRLLERMNWSSYRCNPLDAENILNIVLDKYLLIDGLVDKNFFIGTLLRELHLNYSWTLSVLFKPW